MKLYAQITGNAWFFLPTVGITRHDNGEYMLALIWLQLEVGVRWKGGMSPV